MLDVSRFRSEINAKIDDCTFFKVLHAAILKRDFIIKRYGDCEGYRFTDEYLSSLIREEFMKFQAEQIWEEVFECITA